MTGTAVVEPARRVGFELEDGAWRTWKPGGRAAGHGFRQRDVSGAGIDMQPLAKHEVIDRGAGITMQADEFDADGARLSDVEFVTDAFALTARGRADLLEALEWIPRTYAWLTPLAGHDHAAGDFVAPDRRRLSRAEVLFSGGEAEPRLRVHATQGLALTDIPRFFRALSDDPAAQANPAAAVAIQGSSAPRGRFTAARLEPLRSAAARAATLSLTHLARTLGGAVQLGDGGSLLGLLTVTIAFLRSVHARSMSGGIKTFVPVVHRNDFATMFGLLPGEQQELLRARRDEFVDAIVAGVFGDLKEPRSEHIDRAASAALPVVRRLALNRDDRSALTAGAGLPARVELGGLGSRILCYRPVPRSLTIARWIATWIPADGVDLLTEAHFAAAQMPGEGHRPSRVLEAIRDAPEVAPFVDLIDWAGGCEETGQVVSLGFAWERLSPAQRTILADCVRGLGGRGAATDADHPQLALFENRDVRHGHAGRPGRSDLDTARLTLAVAGDRVAEYFDGMRELFGVT